MTEVTSETIRSLLRRGRYTYTRHAERERQDGRITTSELETALLRSEIIEQYPGEVRSGQPGDARFLLLGFAEHRPIHAVCVVKEAPLEVVLLTVM